MIGAAVRRWLFLLAGQAVHRGPIRLGLAGIVGNYKFLCRFAFEDEALVDLGFGAGSGGEHVAGPGEGVGIPALGFEQARAAEIVVDEIGEVLRGFVVAPEFHGVKTVWRLVIPPNDTPAAIEI